MHPTPSDHPDGHDHVAHGRDHNHPIYIPEGVAESAVSRGQEFLYVPGEILVESRLLDGSDEAGAPLRRRLARFERVGETVPGIVKLRVPSMRRGLTGLVAELRNLTDPPSVGIGLNTVFWPEFHRTYFPAIAPRSVAGDADHLPMIEVARADGRVTVGIVDFGLIDHSPLGGHAKRVPGEKPEVALQDPTGSDPGLLGPYHGHGTFVAGVVAQLCPDARIVHCRAVGPDGHLDDPSIAAAVWRLASDERCSVVVAPLGGFTPDNTAPLAITAVLDRIDGAGFDCVVVAAAGNHKSARPVWPAASKRALAVAAAADHQGTPARAYSSYGDWVDLYALGSDIVSTFYDGDFELDHLAAGDPAKRQNFSGWALWSGTSFAAPRVAARIAAAVLAGGSARAAAAALKAFNAASRQPGFGQFVK